ncbi:SDR family NAD(P)-dependent oxidoreductase [Photobacterium sp. DNB23_23_1]
MKNLFTLEGKTALIVGGSGDIGAAIAIGLANHGAKIGISSRNLEKLEVTAQRIKEATGKDVDIFVSDASDEESVRKMSDEFITKMGKIDILVNSQGLNKKFPAFEHPMDEWDNMFDANVKSIMLTSKYFGKNMMENGGGRIINVSSIGAVRTKPSDISACYGATKGAVDALTLTLAAGWGQHNITVNAIGPIMTETEMMKSIFKQNPELKTGTAARVPMGRIATPEDCAGVAVFFASEAASFVSGQTIYPDGALMTLQ